jgi:hypothetical protein
MKRDIPSINVSISVVLHAAIVHDFHFPTGGKVPSDDLHTHFLLKSLQVLECEERAAANVLDDDTSTASLEFPLYARKKKHAHGERKFIRQLSQFRTPEAHNKNLTNCAYPLIFPSVRTKCDGRPVVLA